MEEEKKKIVKKKKHKLPHTLELFNSCQPKYSKCSSVLFLHLVCFYLFFIPVDVHIHTHTYLQNKKKKKPLCLHGTNNDRSANKPCVTLFKYNIHTYIYKLYIYNTQWSPNLLKSRVLYSYYGLFFNIIFFFTRVVLT